MCGGRAKGRNCRQKGACRLTAHWKAERRVVGRGARTDGRRVQAMPVIKAAC